MIYFILYCKSDIFGPFKFRPPRAKTHFGCNKLSACTAADCMHFRRCICALTLEGGGVPTDAKTRLPAESHANREIFLNIFCTVSRKISAHSNFGLPGLKHIFAATIFRPVLLLTVCTVTLILAKQIFGCNKFSARVRPKIAENKYAPNIC